MFFPDPPKDPPKDPTKEGDYEKVEGIDRKTVELKRAYEAEVEAKVASDYSHIVWAYGLIFALFAGYGAFLLFRSSKLSKDIDDLGKKLK